MNQELPDVPAGFRKGRGTRDQIANICWIMEKGRKLQENMYFCFIAFDGWFATNYGKFLEMRVPGHLTCFLRSLYAGQETTVRTGHQTADWFQIGKGVCQGHILSPCPFNFNAEHIMENAELDESEAGINIAKRNTNSLRYADDNGRNGRGTKEPLDEGERGE